MSADTEAKQIKQLIMLISDLRSRDQEKYESHIKFMNEVVNYIKDISKNMNQVWNSIHEKLEDLNRTISSSLETLLQGIKPEDIRETSKSLENILGTMNRSIQSMNLENVMRELRVLGTADLTFQVAAGTPGGGAMSMGHAGPAAGGPVGRMKPAGRAKPAADLPPELAGYESPALADSGQEIYGAVPTKLKKGAPQDDQPLEEGMYRDEQGRIRRKPRDLFGNIIEDKK